MIINKEEPKDSAINALTAANIKLLETVDEMIARLTFARCVVINSHFQVSATKEKGFPIHERVHDLVYAENDLINAASYCGDSLISVVKSTMEAYEAIAKAMPTPSEEVWEPMASPTVKEGLK